MKNTLSILLFVALFSACTSISPTPRFFYGLGDDDLNLLGQHLGYRVEALGMSVYSFTRGSYVFHVSAHNDISIKRRVQADAAVLLVYNPPGRRPPVEYRFSINRGGTFAAVEEHFRRSSIRCICHAPASNAHENVASPCAAADPAIESLLPSERLAVLAAELSALSYHAS